MANPPRSKTKEEGKADGESHLRPCRLGAVQPSGRSLELPSNEQPRGITVLAGNRQTEFGLQVRRHLRPSRSREREGFQFLLFIPNEVRDPYPIENQRDGKFWLVRHSPGVWTPRCASGFQKKSSPSAGQLRLHLASIQQERDCSHHVGAICFHMSILQPFQHNRPRMSERVVISN